MPIGSVNNVEFALISESRDRVVIPEPINFEDGNGNIYERDSDSKGFLKSKSNDLEYYGEGFDFLLSQYATKGIVEDVKQQKRIKSDDRIDEKWKTVSENYLDLSEATFDDEKRTVKTKVIQGGIYKQIESGLDNEFDLVSETASDGTSIGALKTVNLALEPREIFLRSEATVEDGTRIQAVVSGNDGLNARAIPLQFNPNSDTGNLISAIGNKLAANNGNYAALDFSESQNVFLQNAQTYKEITLNGRVEIRIVDQDFGSLTLDLVRYNNGLDFDYLNKIQLDTVNPQTIGNVASFDFVNYKIEVQEGESLAIAVLTDTFDGVGYEVWNTKIEITEDSGASFPTTQTRALTEFEACNRLVAKILGSNNRIISDLLTNSTRLITQGFWVRQFPDVIKEGTDEERKIQFTTSLEDFIKHIEVTHEPVAWWIETIGNTEYFRIESLKYTQQNFTGIKYKEGDVFIQASDIKRKNLRDNFYGTIEIGSAEGGEGYEEVFGLQSVCGKAFFSTINPTDVVYSMVSPYALGDIDIELPRRKQYDSFPDTDTKYDSIISALDCVKVGNGYRLKKWQDIFSQKPTNIYRADSAYNLDYTPARLLLSHGSNINVGLYHYPNEKITWISSNCNSSFSSIKDGEILITEDGSIPHSMLDKPRVRPKSVDFTLSVDLDLEAQITGITNGVPNWFGLVAVNTGQQIEYMRLVKVDTNKEGKHKLVEAFV